MFKTIEKKELIKKIVVFQDKGYKGNLIFQYIFDPKKKLPVEIFPGIKAEILEDKWFRKFVRILLRKETTYVKFEILNKRDRFDFFEIEEENYSNITECRIEYKWIELDDIVYPDNLGGGKCGGCPVARQFSKVLNSSGYTIITYPEIAEQTKDEPSSIEKCKQSNCYKNFQKIIEEEYREDLPRADMIRLEMRGNQYVPVEGKHRVCAMKRYGYSQKVYAEVSCSQGNNISDDFMMVNYSPSEKSLEEYYNSFELCNINREEVICYLSDLSKSLCHMIIEKREWRD